jgi:glycosyltransferase involved in cell wall biosynthesis
MHVVVFFTFDVSLKLWSDNGVLLRELLIYGRLAKVGYKVTFVTYGDEYDSMILSDTDNFSVIPVYKHMKRSHNTLVRLLRSFLIPFRFKTVFQNADVYKTNQMYGAWIPVLAKILYRKKLIIRCGFEYLHDAMFNSKNIVAKIVNFVPRYLMEFIAYRASNLIVVTSALSKNYIKKMFWVFDGRIQIQPNYVDTDVFKPKKRRLRAISSAAIAFVGRLHPVKNIFALLDALEGTHHRLSIVGGGPQEISLKEYAAKKKIDARFLGIYSYKNLSWVLPEHDVFVLPSMYENNPKALLEAMACGLPVVASDIPGIREIVNHEQNGLLCDPSAHAIRGAIDRLIHNPVLREKLGRNARTTVERDFSIGKVMVQESESYQQMKA